jgi:hypothetical protein
LLDSISPQNSLTLVYAKPMRNISILLVVLAFGSGQAKAQTDSTRYLPKLWIKWAAMPEAMFRNVVFGMEARVWENNSVGFLVGRQLAPRSFYDPYLPIGWDGTLQLRHFFVNPRLSNLFASLNLRQGIGGFNYPAQFTFSGDSYSKTVRIEEQFQTISLSFGFFAASPTNRFPFEMSLGAGFINRRVAISGATPEEEEYISNGNIIQLQPYKPGHFQRPMITANVTIGFVLVR